MYYSERHKVLCQLETIYGELGPALKLPIERWEISTPALQNIYSKLLLQLTPLERELYDE